MPRTPDAIDALVGARIARRRRHLGITQADLARQVGLSPHQIQKYETGANRVSASTLTYIAACLGDHPGAYFPDSPIPFGAGPPRLADKATRNGDDGPPWRNPRLGVSEAGVVFRFEPTFG